MREIHDFLHNNRATLDIARLGLEDMVPVYPAIEPREMDTTASVISSNDCLFGERDSIFSDTRFPFDDLLFGSKAYRSVVARVSAKKRTHGARSDSPDLPLVSESAMDITSTKQEVTASRNLPPVVTSDVHEAVLARLREAEERIRFLEERMKFQDMTATRPQKGAPTQPRLEPAIQQGLPQDSADNIVADTPTKMLRPAYIGSSFISSRLMATEDAAYSHPRSPGIRKETKAKTSVTRIQDKSGSKGDGGNLAVGQSSAVPARFLPANLSTQSSSHALEAQLERLTCLSVNVTTMSDTETPNSKLRFGVELSGNQIKLVNLPENRAIALARAGHRCSRSQPYLLMECFEGGKNANNATEARKPSVQVRLTPSGKSTSRDKIKVKAKMRKMQNVEGSKDINQAGQQFQPTAVEGATATSSVAPRPFPDGRQKDQPSLNDATSDGFPVISLKKHRKSSRSYRRGNWVEDTKPFESVKDTLRRTVVPEWDAERWKKHREDCKLTDGKVDSAKPERREEEAITEAVGEQQQQIDKDGNNLRREGASQSQVGETDDLFSVTADCGCHT